MKNYKYLQLITAVFVSVLLTSNILSSAKIVDTGFSLFGIPLIFDAGLLVFPLCYVFGDIMTEVYGYRAARKVIWSGFLGNLVLVLFIKLAGWMPSETSWSEYAGDEAFAAILGGIASGGIIIASICAYLFGEFSNSYVLAKMKILTRGRQFFARAIGSTMVGQLFDTSIFVLIATLFGVFGTEIIFELIWTNYLFKVLIEIVLFPITFLLVNFLKREENEDYYDRDTNFNPFKITGKT